MDKLVGIIKKRERSLDAHCSVVDAGDGSNRAGGLYPIYLNAKKLLGTWDGEDVSDTIDRKLFAMIWITSATLIVFFDWASYSGGFATFGNKERTIVLAACALVFDIGFSPSLMVCLIWIVNQSVYCKESMRYSKAGDKISSV
ncbi:MAG: DUF3169 family protein [Ruminococcus sp.]|nr:DUF3169 family protein [Ruminococcus sp.]MDD6448065.1 DUF3169 family protein [Ruminococcus sp.]